MEEHQYFFIDIFHNLVDSNLSKVNTDSKANPEFIKPERQEMSYCKDNHICGYGSDYHFAKSLSTLSCTIRNVEQNARICLLVGTWLAILDVAHVILCGDDRFILCTDDHFFASFASLYAIGQMAKQFIFVRITPQESIPVRRNRRSCNHVLPLCVLPSLVDCFRMSVRYLSQTRSTLLTVSSREVIYRRKFAGIGLLLKYVRQAPGLTICTIAAPSKTLTSITGWILSGCEDFVKHSIRSNFDPCRSWPISEMDGGHAWFSCSKKLSRLLCLGWQAMWKREKRVQFVFKDATCSLLLDLSFVSGVLNSANLFLDTMSLSGLLNAMFSLSSINSLNWCWPIYSTVFTVHASLFMTTFVSSVSMSPLSSRIGFPMSAHVANRGRTSLANVCCVLAKLGFGLTGLLCQKRVYGSFEIQDGGYISCR